MSRYRYLHVGGTLKRDYDAYIRLPSDWDDMDDQTRSEWVRTAALDSIKIDYADHDFDKEFRRLKGDDLVEWNVMTDAGRTAPLSEVVQQPKEWLVLQGFCEKKKADWMNAENDQS